MKLRLSTPTNATLAKDIGFQGYEPEGVLTVNAGRARQPGIGGVVHSGRAGT
jgi:hypothetical protein